MQTYFLIAAAALYAVCALLPSRRGALISLMAACAWLTHGAALWAEVLMWGSMHVGFAMMLSSALWLSVAAYWIENRNYALDALRRLVMPCACVAVLLVFAFPGSALRLEGRSPAFAWHI